MKPADLIPLVVLVLAGCQTRTAPKPNPSLPVAAAPAPVAGATAMRSAETIRSYAVGAYVDPDDPLVRHSGHTIYRLEKPATWDLGVTPDQPTPSSPVALPPPVATLTVPPASTPVITPPILSTIPPADIVPPPVITPSLTAPTIEAAPPAPISALTPNADGFVDLSAPEVSPEPDDETNPFAVRAKPLTAAREATLVVSGLMSGPTPGAVINGRALRLGDPIESLVLDRVEGESVLLRSGERRVRLPLSPSPYRLRLAP